MDDQIVPINIYEKKAQTEGILLFNQRDTNFSATKSVRSNQMAIPLRNDNSDRNVFSLLK